MDASGRQGFLMPEEVLADSLRVLSGLLYKHYGQRVILLIDEYDVPLDKAQQAGYYMDRTISIRDTAVRKSRKENFYRGILLGLLSHREDWDIDSNVESGEGSLCIMFLWMVRP